MPHARRLISLALLLAAGAGCRHGAKPHEPSPPPDEAWVTPAQAQRFQLTEVTAHEVGGTLKTAGRIAFDDLRVSHVFSPVTGRLTRILAQPGQRVARGTPLAAIVSPDVGGAFADLAKAQADVAAAQHEFRRQQELYLAHASAQRDFELARDNFARARAELARAREKARLLAHGPVDRVKQEFTLVSPIEGEVVARNANPGVEIQGQYSGATALELFTVGELDRVWVLGDVYEMDLGKVKRGAPVEVRVSAYPERTFRSRIEWVSDTLDPATRTARLRTSLSNPDRALKPEMYATVIVTVAGRLALAVPRQSVLRQGEQLIVFVAGGTSPDGRVIFRRRPVRIDPDGDDPFVEVLDGLQAGERVVSSSAIELLGVIS